MREVLKQLTIWAIVSVTLAGGCAEDDPIPTVTPSTTVVDAGVNVGFADPAMAGPGHEGSIPSTSTTTSTTTTTTTTLPPAFDDVPADIATAISELWPEDHWNLAVNVSWCESRWQLDAANPTSSARGVFQLLAPWTRDPGSGRTVWGWEYTDSGEKLSAAASLGIDEHDARYGIGNITVAHAIWEREGWRPWAASQTCWAGMS